MPVFMPQVQSKPAVSKPQFIEAQVVQAIPINVMPMKMPVSMKMTMPMKAAAMMTGKGGGQPAPAQPIHEQVVNVMPMQGGWD